MVPQNTSKNIKILCLKTWHCYDIVLIKSHSSIALLMFVKLQICNYSEFSKHDSCKENVSNTKQRKII